MNRYQMIGIIYINLGMSETERATERDCGGRGRGGGLRPKNTESMCLCWTAAGGLEQRSGVVGVVGAKAACHKV